MSTFQAKFKTWWLLFHAGVLLGMHVVCGGSASATDETESEEGANEEYGKITRRYYDFKDAEKEMEYALYVPTSYVAEKETPIIVALHGLGSNPQQIIRYPHFVENAEEHGYIIVAPMGYNSRGWYGSRGPRGVRRSDPENLGELSEQDVMNVLQLMRDEFNVDDRRIYLLGHSMGGGGTFHLAIKYPDIWAAMAPLAPAVPRDSSRLEAAKHIPAIVVQGDRDRLVRGTRIWIERMKELEMDHKYLEIEGGDHVTVAFQHFPEIFEFFNEHVKGDDEADE